MDVSIIIVNYNTLAITQQCIDSIIKHTLGCTYEIIVIDNNSSDGSIQVLSKDKRIIFISSEENLGFGKANNLGIEKASGKYVFFLNSDTYFLNDAVTCFFSFCETHSIDKMGGVGSILLDPKEKSVHSFAKFPSLSSIFLDYYIAPFYKLFGKEYKCFDTTNSDQSKDFYRVDYITGADLFVNKRIIDEYGAFDPDFFMYYEETEMQHRWTKHGYPSFIYNRPQIVHLEGYTSKKTKKKNNKNKFFWVLEGQRLYCKKCFSKTNYYIFRIIFLSNMFHILNGKYTYGQIKKMMKIVFHY